MAGTWAEDEVRAVLDQLNDAQNAGDSDRVRLLLSERPDAVHIGTDAEEWWTSERLVAAMAAGGDGDDLRGVIDDLGIHVQGDVAWAEGRARFVNGSGGDRPIRVTAVLVREDGQWRVVQSHASIGVPNADIFA